MNNILKDLNFALSMKRPHGGYGVTALCDYIVGRVAAFNPTIDYSGNIHVDLRQSPNNGTLFTSHVDTVHRHDGRNHIKYEGNFVFSNEKGSPLGADDAAGVSVLLHMIDNNVPAYYIFFQGEEQGGIGSKWLAKSEIELLCNFKRAVAFDRKDVYSVITHQGWGKCCSDEFALALANDLNIAEDMFVFTPDETGIYTDTAEFTHIISECTNISVGYYNEHSDREKLDIVHLQALAKACLKVDWDNLPTVRDVRDDGKEFKKVETKSSDPVVIHQFNDQYFENDDDEEASALFEALDSARSGNTSQLSYLIAEYITPDEPSLSYKHIKQKGMSLELISEVEDMMYQGYELENIYEILFERLYDYSY